MTDAYRRCTLCPRMCGVDRTAGQMGVCGMTDTLMVGRAALHFWEEPCLSGSRGSGTVFFSGCNLRCVFCQNYALSTVHDGVAITAERLGEIFLELEAQGAHNVNLVTPTHYVPHIIKAINYAYSHRISIPFVYNCGGYESVETLKMLDGLIDIYLPDCKYDHPDYAARYSSARDYPKVVRAAIAEMVRQCTPIEWDNDGMMRRGVIVRHLMLPGRMSETKEILRDLYDAYGDQIFISLMNQYTPLPHCSAFPELCRTITAEEYDEAVSFAQRIGIQNAFIQEGGTQKESFIPLFDGTGCVK